MTNIPEQLAQLVHRVARSFQIGSHRPPKSRQLITEGAQQLGYLGQALR
jgi:hypothetical protein